MRIHHGDRQLPVPRSAPAFRHHGFDDLGRTVGRDGGAIGDVVGHGIGDLGLLGTGVRGGEESAEAEEQRDGVPHVSRVPG